MSDQRRAGETVEQYAQRLVSTHEDEAFLFSCSFCAGHETMGLCDVLHRIDPTGFARVHEDLRAVQTPPDDRAGADAR